MKTTSDAATTVQPPAGSGGRSDRTKRFLLSSLLVLLVFAAYQPALNNGFTSWDDPAYVTSNAQIQQGITWQNIRWAFTHTVASNWHPLTVLSHMLDCQWFGPKAWGHHLVNLLWHSANAVLLFWLLFTMTGAPWRSFFVAALFGVHPLNVESVAWISERKNVLSTFFALLTLLSYAKFSKKVENGGQMTEAGGQKPDVGNPPSVFRLPSSGIWYLSSVFFFMAGLLAKPMLVTVPFVLLLLDYWPLNRVQGSLFKVQSWTRLLMEKIPFFAITAAFCLVTVLSQKKADALITTGALPLPFRIENALVSYVHYLSEAFWPAHLSYFYIYSSLPMIVVVGAALVLVLVSASAWNMRSKMPYALVGWLWFLGTLVPVIGLVQVGEQAMADRYTYVPLIGIEFLVVWGLHQWVPHRRLLAVVGAIVLLACVGLTRQQAGYWKDSETLYRHAIDVDPKNWAAHASLGRTFRAQGKIDDAIAEYQTSLALFPNNSDVHNNLGIAYMAREQPDKAILEFKEAVRLRPNLPGSHVNLGTLLYEQGHTEDAIAEFREALRLKPDDASAQHNLNILLQKQVEQLPKAAK
jgi:protein O-mannosyl-transferase